MRGKPIGYQRVNGEGYLIQKVVMSPPTWRLAHHIEWEEVNGKIKKGMDLRCINGNRLDTDPSNWLMSPKGKCVGTQNYKSKGYAQIGEIRINKNGYVIKKINNDPDTRKRWELLHRLNWIEKNGPVPEGYVLQSVDGSKQNTDASNWRLIRQGKISSLGENHHRLRKEGYLKTSSSGYVIQKTKEKWISVHKKRWEEVNGPIPPGHVLKCRDCNKENTDPSNWIAIPMAALLSLNGRHNSVSYEESAPEVKPVMLGIVLLEARVKERKRQG